MSPSAKRGTLSEEVADRLINSILSGKFRFGERLPAERDLAHYLSVGRPTLREAIRIVSALGLVEVRHGDGTFVVDNHAEFIGRAFSWTVLLDSQSVEELIESRVAIESTLAELAAQRAEPGEIARLRGLVEAMARSGGNRKAFTKADIDFHLAIAELARNVTLSRLLFALQSLLRQWIDRALRASSENYEVALDHHREIFAAIEAHDPVAAHAAMRKHVLHVGEIIRTASTRSRMRGTPAVSAATKAHAKGP
jgi:GntR family transcriptional repressor for pyruvate dehydrogenase complex